MDPLSTYLPKDLINKVYEYSNPFLEAHKKKMRKIIRTFYQTKQFNLYCLLKDMAEQGMLSNTSRQYIDNELDKYIFSPTEILNTDAVMKCVNNRRRVRKSIERLLALR